MPKNRRRDNGPRDYPKPHRKEIAELENCLAESGLSIQEFADVVGVGHSVVRRFLRGQTMRISSLTTIRAFMAQENGHKAAEPEPAGAPPWGDSDQEKLRKVVAWKNRYQQEAPTWAGWVELEQALGLRR